jgi:hypothetical protein
MASTGAKIVLGAGAVTFTGEWYWQHVIDWKVPLAAVLLAGGTEMLAAADNNAATILAVLILAGALSTDFKGHSAFDMITTLVKAGGKAGTSARAKTQTVVQ